MASRRSGRRPAEPRGKQPELLRQLHQVHWFLQEQRPLVVSKALELAVRRRETRQHDGRKAGLLAAQPLQKHEPIHVWEIHVAKQDIEASEGRFPQTDGSGSTGNGLHTAPVAFQELRAHFSRQRVVLDEQNAKTATLSANRSGPRVHRLRHRVRLLSFLSLRCDSGSSDSSLHEHAEYALSKFDHRGFSTHRSLAG